MLKKYGVTISACSSAFVTVIAGYPVPFIYVLPINYYTLYISKNIELPLLNAILLFQISVRCYQNKDADKPSKIQHNNQFNLTNIP
jgi:hypothetical protein